MVAEARGGLEKLKAVQSVRMKGTHDDGAGLSRRPITIEMKRPENARMEFTLQGMTGVQAYDGQKAWGILPMGSRQPEPLPAEMARSLDNQADIDGPLVDYKAKGHQVELVGKEKIDTATSGSSRSRSRAATCCTCYSTPLPPRDPRRDAARLIRGTEVEIENTLGDYQEVGGVLWPHSIAVGRQGPAGEADLRVRVDRGQPGDRRRALQDAAARPADAPSRTDVPRPLDPIRVFITGGTFDKSYDEITGKLDFKDTHIQEMLRLGRCRLPGRGAHADDARQPRDDRRRPPADPAELPRRRRGAHRRSPTAPTP